MSREQSLELRVLELEATIRRLEAAAVTSEAAGELIIAASRRIVELAAECLKVERQRDAARDVAVRLEQENAEQARTIDELIAITDDVRLVPVHGDTSPALDVPAEGSWRSVMDEISEDCTERDEHVYGPDAAGMLSCRYCGKPCDL